MKKKIAITSGWLISAVLLYLLLRNIDAPDFLEQLKSVKVLPLILAGILNFSVIFLKVFRWYIITPKEGRATFKSTTVATFIGLTGNNLFPARAGDIIKIIMLNKSSKMTKSGLLSLTGLEKIFDIATFITIAFVLIFCLKAPSWFNTGLQILTVTLILSLVASFLIIMFSKKDVFPHKLNNFVKDLASGLQTLKNIKTILVAYILSIPICAVQIFTIILCQYSFGITLPLTAPVLVFIAINVAIIIPSAPSNLGSFELATVLAYSVFGLSSEQSLGIAVFYHAIQVIPITLTGLILVGKKNISLFKHPENTDILPNS